jgi:hypothetical protein
MIFTLVRGDYRTSPAKSTMGMAHLRPEYKIDTLADY